jgi:two-component system LytT family response regulator
MKIRCLIVDDKPLAIDLLTEYIIKISFLELIATTTDPVNGLQLIRTHNISLVFLDIQMPQLSGIQFLKLAGAGVKTILTTAYSKYAIDGYEHDVVDYLLKPIAFDRFYQAAEKALRGMNQNRDFADQVLPQAQAMNAYLFVRTEHRIQKINLRTGKLHFYSDA